MGTSSKTVNYAASYGDLPTPVYSHHDFGGWYTAASGGTKVTSATQVSSTTTHTLYAHWTATTYKITYNANGGTGSVPQQSYSYGSNVTLAASPNLWKDGKEIVGWCTASNGTGTVYSLGASMIANYEGLTLYAKWADPSTTLVISGTHNLTKARVYDKFGYYHDYTSYTNMVVYPGKDIILYHSSGVWKTNNGSETIDLGESTSYYITVPSDASGSATITMFASGAGVDQITAGSGWAESAICTPLSFGFTYGSFGNSNRGIDPITVYDKYGIAHVYRLGSYSHMTAYPGCRIVMKATVEGKGGWTYFPASGGHINLGVGEACRFTVPSTAASPAILYFDLSSTIGHGVFYLDSNQTTAWAREIVPELGE